MPRETRMAARSASSGCSAASYFNRLPDGPSSHSQSSSAHCPVAVFASKTPIMSVSSPVPPGTPSRPSEVSVTALSLTRISMGRPHASIMPLSYPSRQLLDRVGQATMLDGKLHNPSFHYMHPGMGQPSRWHRVARADCDDEASEENERYRHKTPHGFVTALAAEQCFD